MYMYGGFFHPWFGFWGLGWPIVAAIVIIPFWRICTRVGLSPWLSLLLIVPIANLVFVYVLAFGEWPALRGGTGPGMGTGGRPPFPPPPPPPGSGPSAPGR